MDEPSQMVEIILVSCKTALTRTNFIILSSSTLVTFGFRPFQWQTNKVDFCWPIHGRELQTAPL